MNHWSVEEKHMREKDPEAFALWNLEHAINFGLGKKPLKKTELLKYWDRLDLDTHKKKFLSILLHKQ